METPERRVAWGALSGPVLIAAADQASKAVVARSVDDPLTILRGSVGYIEFDLAHNTGGAFSLFASYGTVIAAITGLVIAVILGALVSGWGSGSWSALGLAMIAGGALGNFIDRVRLGYVVDFIEVGTSQSLRWPTFNLADASIVVGTLIVVFVLLRSEVQL